MFLTGGVLFLIAGILWMFFKGVLLESFSQLLADFFTTGEDAPWIAGPWWAGDFSSLLFLLPGVLLLGYAWLNKIIFNGKYSITLIAFYTGTGLLYFTLITLIVNIYISFTIPFPSLPTGLAIILLLVTQVVYITRIVQKQKVHYASICIFGLSTLLFAYYFDINWMFLFQLTLFTVILFLFTYNPSVRRVNTINGLFVIVLYGLYFFRKLVIRDQPEMVWSYIGNATFLYILLIAFRIITPLDEKNYLSKIISDLYIFVLAAFYFVTVWYVIQKYEQVWMQGFFALLMTGVNYIFLRFARKIGKGQFTAPLLYITIFTAASIIPLFIQQNHTVLFTGTAAIILIVTAKYLKNKFAGILAATSVTIAFFSLLTKTILAYYTEITYDTTNLSSETFGYKLILGLVVTCSAFLVRYYLRKISYKGTFRWFSKKKTMLILSFMTFSAAYITYFWVFQFVIFSIFHVPEAQIVGWYYYHICFFLLLQGYNPLEKTWVYTFLNILAIASVTILPVLINFLLIDLRELSLTGVPDVKRFFYLHFLFLIPLIALFVRLTTRLRKSFSRSKIKTGMITLLQISFGVYFFLAEFDHLTFLMSTTASGMDTIEANQRLAYTLVLFLTTILLLLFSYLQNVKFLGQASIVLLIFCVLKLFFFDFDSMSSFGQALSFWLVGGFLFLYSYLYKRTYLNLKNSKEKR